MTIEQIVASVSAAGFPFEMANGWQAVRQRRHHHVLTVVGDGAGRQIELETTREVPRLRYFPLTGGGVAGVIEALNTLEAE